MDKEKAASADPEVLRQLFLDGNCTINVVAQRLGLNLEEARIRAAEWLGLTEHGSAVPPIEDTAPPAKDAVVGVSIMKTPDGHYEATPIGEPTVMELQMMLNYVLVNVEADLMANHVVSTLQRISAPTSPIIDPVTGKRVRSEQTSEPNDDQREE